MFINRVLLSKAYFYLYQGRYRKTLQSTKNLWKLNEPFLTLQLTLNSFAKRQHNSIPRNHITKPFHFQLNLPRNYNALTHMHVHYNTSLV